VTEETHSKDAQSLDVLTRQQEQALKAFRVDGEAYDGSIWDEGVRPWPTMDNLVKLGYVERVQWWDEEAGWQYELT
jgi:hypothetical protein